MSLVLFHFFYAQHVSDINSPIVRSLRLFYYITTLAVCSCFDVCWSFGVAGWGGIRVAGFSLPHGYHPNPATPKHQHTSKQEHTTNVVIQGGSNMTGTDVARFTHKQSRSYLNHLVQSKSRRLLTMDVLMPEKC